MYAAAYRHGPSILGFFSRVPFSFPPLLYFNKALRSFLCIYLYSFREHSVCLLHCSPSRLLLRKCLSHLQAGGQKKKKAAVANLH